jgi:hypothetical protein
VTTSLPAGSVPVEELPSSSALLAFRGTTVAKLRPPAIPTVSTFDDYIAALPLWDKRLLTAIDLVDADGLLAHLLSNAVLFLVSDGGAYEDLGSFGALVASEDKTFATVSGTTEGVLPGSHQAESYDCLTILRFLHHFLAYHKVPIPKTLNKFYCDNQSLITRLTQAAGPLPHLPRNYLRSDIDLKIQIVDTPRLMELNLSYTHVLGHQDEDTDKPLMREATLNVACDAKLQTATPSPLVTPFPAASRISLTVSGVSINRKLARQIRDLVGHTRQLSSFQQWYGWTATQFDQLDWPLFRLSVFFFALTKRFFLLKWLNNHFPVQTRMDRYGQASLTGCPEECSRDSEDQLHLVRCPAPQRREVLENMQEDVDQIVSSTRLLRRAQRTTH